ncbi:MAG: hypothetical protein ACKOW9_01355 [Candidatus Paceibacterota bacterium]
MSKNNTKENTLLSRRAFVQLTNERNVRKDVVKKLAILAKKQKTK